MNKKGKQRAKDAAARSDPPRIVLAVGISHPQIVADWRKAYTIQKMDGSNETCAAIY